MKNKILALSVVAIGLLTVVLAGIFFVKNHQPKSEQGLESTLPVSQRYQKVESGVKVTVQRVGDGRRVDFHVDKILSKYKTIEYEYSYKTSTGGLQGGIGSTTKIKDGRYQKEILLGTCSAGGACTYDEGVEKIKFTIFFSTGAEKRYFEKTFNI